MGPWSHTAAACGCFPHAQFARRGASGCFSTLPHFWAFRVISLGSACLPRTKLSRLRFVLFCLREANCKTRAAVVTIFSRECPAVRFDDAARNGEPHSGAFYFC